MQYQKAITLKDGTPCLIRNAKETDAQEMLRDFHLTHAETDFLLMYPEESAFTAQQETAFVKEKEQSENTIEICAIVGERVVGTAGFAPVGNQEKLRYRAEFGIAIEKAYWGKGIGRALTLACIECAKKAGFLQLELDVVAENKAAIGLYASVGFQEFGRNPKGFRSRHGWQELVLMRLELDR